MGTVKQFIKHDKTEVFVCTIIAGQLRPLQKSFLYIDFLATEAEKMDSVSRGIGKKKTAPQ